jgi:hypothetical protein
MESKSVNVTHTSTLPTFLEGSSSPLPMPIFVTRVRLKELIDGELLIGCRLALCPGKTS